MYRFLLCSWEVSAAPAASAAASAAPNLAPQVMIRHRPKKKEKT